MVKEKGLPIRTQTSNIKKASLPFPNEIFDAVYSHMPVNMKFSMDELHFVFSEIMRVLKPNWLNYFSVRNNNDKFSGNCKETEKGIYCMIGFEIRFFTKKDIQDLMVEWRFQIGWIREEYEEPVTLYLASEIKKR